MKAEQLCCLCHMRTNDVETRFHLLLQVQRHFKSSTLILRKKHQHEPSRNAVCILIHQHRTT